MSRSTINWLLYTPLVVISLIFVHPRFNGGSELVDELVDILGFTVLVVGLLTRVVSRNWKSSNNSAGLIVTGPYSVVRNPMYIGSYLVVLGLCIIIGNIIFLIGSTIVYFLVQIIIVRKEERDLSKRWPEDYQRYKASVPAWIPSLSRISEICKFRQWLSNPERAVDRELNLFCGSLIGAALLEAYEDYTVKGWALAKVDVTIFLFLATLIFIVWTLRIIRSR